MDITKINITLAEDTYAYIYRASEKENSETFKEQVKKYIDTIDNLVNADFSKLSDEEFYDLLCKIYNISLEEKDFLEIISKRNNDKYDRFVEIGTYMTFSSTNTEGKGKNFSWWEQLYQIRYIVAVAEGCWNIDNDSIFSKEDIKNMIDDKSIVIIAKKDKPLNSKPNFKSEDVQNFPLMNLNFSNSLFGMYGSIHKDENFSVVVSMLRKRFTKRRILKDMRDYVEELQCQIDRVLFKNSDDYAYNEIAKLCGEWFEVSEEKQTYSRLVKKIKDRK